MAKGDAYIGITRYLEKVKEHRLTLTFDQIKEINDGHLPASAYKHQAWWANTESHSEAFGWLNAGFRTVEIDIISQKITFERVMDAPAE